ncbi:glycosyltransferase family 2 protein [candidate division WS5 bacterium]|uniref:Glycosyltransferase family 2 protein n=1 Tax=candidate division WS5 bacterium TaxID=2093353 RepID=A0A419DGI8_9BACT|nr:MAG: glycosyltransferase family 2 protein [candidate division WS5 bacterium]
MFGNKTIGIIIPAYRVEKQIGKVIAKIPDFVDKIIIVNDASTDRTTEIIRRMNNSKILLIEHKKNQGVGGAMKSGFRKAIELNIDIVVKVDGDNQMDINYLPALITPIIENYADYTKGNRFLDSKDLVQMPFQRFLGNLFLTFITKVASGYWHIFDSQNGYLAISLDTLKKIDLDKLDNYYFFENSMLININIFEARVADIFIPARYLDEKSSLKISKVLWYFPCKLLKGLILRIYYKYIFFDLSPIVVFLLCGLFLFFPGLFFGLFIWVKTLKTHIPTPTGTIILALLPIMIGFQLILQALVLEITQSSRIKGLRYSLEEMDILIKKYT